MQEKIFALAASLTGIGDEEQELLKTLCAAAEQMWQRRLRPGITPEDCGEAFDCAAAFTAAAEFGTGRGGGVESFAVGELSVKTGTGGDRSAAWRKSAERLMAPYVQEDFCFKGVQG